MPAYADYHAIKDPFLDRRTKLLPCQREMVHHWYERGHSITSIAKLFHVNKRLIQFEMFPERRKKNIEHRKDRGGSSIYYDKEAHTKAIANYRKYKHKLFVNDYSGL